jgi:DNA end-binding protein Ku
MPRAYWKGFLKLSLVSCPIALYPATTSAEKTHFHQINKRTGHRLQQQMVDSETGRVVDKEHKGRGYELSKGRFVEVEEEELDAVQIESTHTIDVDEFVPQEEIDERYLDRPYYIAPDGKTGADAFAVIRDAMKKKKMVGIARVVMARRERIMMLEPFGKGIMGTTLHYPYEIRSDDAVFEEIPEMKLPDQMIGLAEDIIDKMTGEFEPDKFEDRYENAMIELIRSKQEGLPAPKEKPAARPANVVNLMDALRRSVEGETGKAKPAKAAPAKKAEPAAKPKRKVAKG